MKKCQKQTVDQLQMLATESSMSEINLRPYYTLYHRDTVLIHPSCTDISNNIVYCLCRSYFTPPYFR